MNVELLMNAQAAEKSSIFILLEIGMGFVYKLAMTFS